MASSHIIEECVNRSQSSQNRCTYQTPSNATTIILTCVVSGFKPDISMMWTDESGERLQSMASLQTTLSDDTYERIEKINVSANHGTEKTFACIATGDAVNETSTKEITLLATSIISGKRNNVGLIIGLVIGILAAVTILVLLVRKCRDQDYVPQGVSEESPPTVQTNMNIGDESRKWYSVQWSDFKFDTAISRRRPRDVSILRLNNNGIYVFTQRSKRGRRSRTTAADSSCVPGSHRRGSRRPTRTRVQAENCDSQR
ncbi:uncharacterized protein [Diadema setosum]|uniref:uncharacterized protein n=1 Tax=Diadema setosum TaxID=31175 RepID=UPI003B39FB89